MTELKRMLYLLSAFAAILFLPYSGAWLLYDGVFPKDFFDFPPLTAPAKDGFSMPIFILVSLLCAGIAMLYCFPQIFGFKQTKPVEPAVKSGSRLPVWFWVGLFLWGSTLFVLWSKLEEPKWLINWACLPLFWGFTLMLDGWVYVRTDGKSLVATAPRELLAMGAVSISGWLIFEYLNFFVYENWTYPRGNLLPDDEFVMYAILGSSGLMPMAFQWYSLFESFPGLRNKYRAGPKITLPRWLLLVLLVVMLGGLFAISRYPDTLFGLLWTAPLIILAIALRFLGLRTPFTHIGEGNWSPLMLMSLTYLVQGFLCEGWNYFSATHANGQLAHTVNPDYWTYSVPYVNVFHIFEMPALGFAGYLPFGAYCAIWWITSAWLLNIPTRFLQ